MHPRTMAKTKEITKTVLALLAAGGTATLVSMLSEGRHSSRLAHLLAQYGKWRIRYTLKRLRLQGYIQYDADDERSPITLTEKGERQARRFSFRSPHQRKKKRWDYLWRMVIFDIPEKQKDLRELFRKELRAAGFFPLQRSIFVTPYAYEKEIDDLCACWSLRRYVLVFVTASLGRAEKNVRRFFFHR